MRASGRERGRAVDAAVDVSMDALPPTARQRGAAAPATDRNELQCYILATLFHLGAPGGVWDVMRCRASDGAVSRR